MTFKEVDVTAWDIVFYGLIAVALLCSAFLFGQSWRANRAYCEAVCYPADPVACEKDFAVCWNDEHIRKLKRPK